MSRRGQDDPTGLGLYANWSWSWPANRRVLYNRASADENGTPWDETRAAIRWQNGRYAGDVPDYKADAPPDALGSFIMLARGSRQALRAGLCRRPVSRALRAGGVSRRQRHASGRRHESRGDDLHRRARSPRRSGYVPVRRVDLPADRALPLLDEARQDDVASAVELFRRSPRSARERKGHPKRRSGARDARRAVTRKGRRW